MSEALPFSSPAIPDGSAPTARATTAWPAIGSLALGVFGLVTAEFLPPSLLTPMARDALLTNPDWVARVQAGEEAGLKPFNASDLAVYA